MNIQDRFLEYADAFEITYEDNISQNAMHLEAVETMRVCYGQECDSSWNRL